MKPILTIITLWLFPSGLFLLTAGLLYQWFDRKLLALLQKIGLVPRWFQPFADTFKLLSKEEIHSGRSQFFSVHRPSSGSFGRGADRGALRADGRPGTFLWIFGRSDCRALLA